MAADPKTVAQGFTDFYYAAFSKNRMTLRDLYRPHSMFSFEGTDLQGTDAIMEKLMSLPFQSAQFNIVTTDVHPCNPQAGSILIMITGQLITEGQDKPLAFAQTFQLLPDGASYYIFNEMFRLSYG